MFNPALSLSKTFWTQFKDLSKSSSMEIQWNDLFALYVHASNCYYSTQEDVESPISDQVFDLIVNEIERRFPGYPVLQNTGAMTKEEYLEYNGLNAAMIHFDPVDDSRGGKMALPEPMGSMVQVHDDAEIDRWIKNINDPEIKFIVSDKLDGQSCELVYGIGGRLRSAFSKTTSTEGRDIIRHVRKIPSVPKQISKPGVIRVELEIKETVFSKKYKQYKTARNMVAGRMNAKQTSQEILNDIHALAYTMYDSEDMSKHEQFIWLKEEGFETPYHKVLSGEDLTSDFLSDEVKTRKAINPFLMDGIVIDIDDPQVRKSLGTETNSFNPKYARKFKIDGDIITTTVVGVHWRPSKDGYQKPRVEIEPVEIDGVTITFASGFNAFYIKHGCLFDDFKDGVEAKPIGLGAVITIMRSGDVIPDIQEVLFAATSADLPTEDDFGAMEWTDSGIDMVLKNPDDNVTVQLNRMVYFFGTLGVEEFSEGLIKKFMENGFDSLSKIIRMKIADMLALPGIQDRTANKIYNNIHGALDNAYLPALMAATGYFGRALAVGRIEKLYKKFEGKIQQEDWIKSDLPVIRTVSNLSQWEKETATQYFNGLSPFREFMDSNQDFINLVEYEAPELTSDKLKDQVIVLTNFRDAGLQELIETNGGSVKSGVSKKTTILVNGNPDKITTKIKKAESLGVTIHTRKSFQEFLQGMEI